MLSHNVNFRLLVSSILLRVGDACAGSGYSSFPAAVDDVVTTAVACGQNFVSSANNEAGYVASACNAQQAVYAAMAGPRVAAANGVCYCKKTFYDPLGQPGATLGQVDLWTTCVGPWNTLFVRLGYLAVQYEDDNAPALFTTCNACSDTPFTPIAETLEQVESVLDFVLDWRGDLYNRETALLAEGMKALVSGALLDGGVPNGKASPSLDFVVSAITKGYTPPPDKALEPRQQATALLESRQAANSSGNDIDPALQLISDSIDIRITALMVPVNGSTNQLTDQIKARFANSTFADELATFKANLTAASYSVVKGDPGNTTATASASGTASGTGSAVSATGTNAASGRRGDDKRMGEALFWEIMVGSLVAFL